MKRWIIIVSILTIAEQRSEKQCKVTRTKGYVVANCSGLTLEYVPRDLPDSITYLDLRNNNLSHLLRNDFVKYKRLKVLYLNKNNLSVLEEDVFVEKRYLERLFIRYNRLNISCLGDVFKSLTRLQILDLRNNFYDYLIPREHVHVYPYFGNMKYLTDLYLDLASNPDFRESGIIRLSNLKTLRFGICQIRKMANQTFLGFPINVESIKFVKCNSVQLIDADFLKPFPRLLTLIILHSRILLKDVLQLVYPFVNKTMKMVSFIGVGDSQKDSSSVTVTKQMMTYLQKIRLETLVLAETSIVDFEPGSLLTFDHPECFEAIILTGNRFDFFLGDKMKDFFILKSKVVNLKIFDFSFIPIMFNDISYLPWSIGSVFNVDYTVTEFNKRKLKNTRIQDRRVNYNTKDLMPKPPMEVSDSRTYDVKFALPPNLKLLRLSHILVPNNFAENVVIENVTNLEYLDMSYYQLRNVPNIKIIGNNSLKYLDVSGIDASLYLKKINILSVTKLTTAILKNARIGYALFQNRSLFHSMPFVKKLDVSFNSLWSLNSDVFIKNKDLETLNLQRNIFKEIPLATISLPKLLYLDIRFNYIQHINETLREWFERQNTKFGAKFKLLLYGNIFRCSCVTSDFIQWLQNTKLRLDETLDKYLCRLDNGTQTTILAANKHFHELFCDCHSETWLRIGIACLSVFFVITVPGAIIFNFRWNIAYFIYRKFKRVVEERLNKTFVYDVYVSYAAGEANWVKSTLVPKIEQSWGMKLCILDRDFVVGEYTSDSIANAIKESRNVFFVISDSFSIREWTGFEIQRAKYEKYTSNLQNIIVIIKQSTMNDIPIELEEIWNDISVIHWSLDDDELGWDRLRIILFSQPC